MDLRFTVLASGSAGNATVIETGDGAVLLDAGLGPQQLAARCRAARISSSHIRALVLTHTHTDHWKDATLGYLYRQGATVFCHPGHQDILARQSEWFATLHEAGLMQAYEAGKAWTLFRGLSCIPVPVRHDSHPTFGFRFEGAGDLFGQASAIGYAADLGCWDDVVVDALADVDLLAVEFNHDVALEKASNRHWQTIYRVLGDDGHLSNEQGAALVRAVAAQSTTGRLRQIVQLHLSRDCNRPELARRAARSILPEGARLHTADQDVPGPTFHLNNAASMPRRGRGRPAPR
jgi:phosphoribosyl 1,2-cyclic phosphodiesterase